MSTTVEIQPGRTAHPTAGLSPGIREISRPVRDHAAARRMDTTLQVGSPS